jgi:hypothetical protein
MLFEVTDMHLIYGEVRHASGNKNVLQRAGWALPSQYVYIHDCFLNYKKVTVAVLPANNIELPGAASNQTDLLPTDSL